MLKNSRYTEPIKKVETPSFMIKYKNAQEFVEKAKFGRNQRQVCLLSGKFIMGDILEATIRKFQLKVKHLSISCLAINEENVLMYERLLKDGFVEKLDIIISDYFYSHEKHKIIPQIYKHCDFEDRFQLAVAKVHTKIIAFEVENENLFFTIYGSANMRSSDNVEQITIEENKEVYDFFVDFHNEIVKKYATIKKTARYVRVEM